MDLDDKTNSSDAVSSGSGGSPWDEPLDQPEKDESPKIIGTLEPKADALPEKEEKPVPFNIPKDIDEQVGNKVPASSVASNDQIVTPAGPAKATLAPNTTLPALDPSGKPIAQNNADLRNTSTNASATLSLQSPKVDKTVGDGNIPLANMGEQPEVSPKSDASVPIGKPKKKGLFSLFKRKKNSMPSPSLPQSVDPLAQAVPQKKSAPQSQFGSNIAPEVNAQPSTAPSTSIAKPAQKFPNLPSKIAAPAFAKSGKPSFFKKPSFAIVSGIVLLLVATTFLTEAGVLSIGLENIYGTLGIESLWGGMPKNPEKALAIAVVNNENHPNFKMSGSLSLTVNKTIKSDVTAPLVSMIDLPIALFDQQVGSAISAVFAQYEDYYSSNTSSDPTSTSSASPNDTATPSVDSVTGGSSSSSPSSIGDQSQYPSYQTQETTIKQLDFTFSGSSNKDSSSVDVTMKKLVGADSKISLINSNNDLFVKTGSEIKFDPKADPNKWLDYKIGSMSNSQSGVAQFFGAKPDQNFSIIGNRIANEKVGSTRCFNYQIEKLEVGGMFDSLGIKSDMIQKINGNIWIGVSDHLIHKIDLIIIPSISSSVTRAEINIELSGFDIENNITVPSLDDKIEVLVASAAPADNTSTPATTTNPTATPTASTAEQNDNLRKTDLAKIKGGLQAYKQKYGNYPVSSSFLHLDSSGNVVSNALVPTYIDSMPGDPKAADGWFYGYTSDGKTFKLSARFENLTDREITKVGDIYLHYVYND